MTYAIVFLVSIGIVTCGVELVTTKNHFRTSHCNAFLTVFLACSADILFETHGGWLSLSWKGNRSIFTFHYQAQADERAAILKDQLDARRQAVFDRVPREAKAEAKQNEVNKY